MNKQNNPSLRGVPHRRGDESPLFIMKATITQHEIAASLTLLAMTFYVVVQNYVMNSRYTTLGRTKCEEHARNHEA